MYLHSLDNHKTFCETRLPVLLNFNDLPDYQSTSELANIAMSTVFLAEQVEPQAGNLSMLSTGA